jgi:hypothetical protein
MLAGQGVPGINDSTEVVFISPCCGFVLRWQPGEIWGLLEIAKIRFIMNIAGQGDTIEEACGNYR